MKILFPLFRVQFFMKATQLEQMREDYVYIKTSKNVTEEKLAQYNEVCTRFY